MSAPDGFQAMRPGRTSFCVSILAHLFCAGQGELIRSPGLLELFPLLAGQVLVERVVVLLRQGSQIRQLNLVEAAHADAFGGQAAGRDVIADGSSDRPMMAPALGVETYV